MARAKARSWIKLVAGLVVGATAQPLFTSVVPFAVSGSALLAAPLPDRPVAVHDALHNAIEGYRRGDYEASALLFQDVLNRQEELTDSEKKEFAHYWQANVTAIEGRREGGRQLRVIERALLENRTDAARELLKQVVPNEPYLTAADKTKFTELSAKLQGKPLEKAASSAKPIELPQPIPVVPQPLEKPLPSGGTLGLTVEAKPDLAQARAKVQQARAQLNQANLELAEKLAREVDRMGVTFPPAEDTPAKVQQDIVKARNDAKLLLLAARAAMGRQEFEAAERYAKQSEAVAGTFTFPVWSSDNPSKVLKELDALKIKKPEHPAATAQIVPTPSPSASTQHPNPVVPASVAKLETPAPVVQTTSSKPADVAPGTPSKTDNARALIKQGYTALRDKKLAQAKQLAEQAKALKSNLEWWEDTPEKLLGDIERAEAKTAPPPHEKPEPILQTNAVKPVMPPSDKQPTTKEEAVALVKTARTQLADGKFDDAQLSAMKARAVKKATWGIFDDAPEAVLKDIEKARAERDQAEAVKVLAQGRQCLEKNDWEGAQKAAYHAQKLHGPYKFWELGDRPDKLLTDAQELRDKQHKQATPVIKKDEKKDEKKPAVMPQPPVVKTPTPAPASGTQTASSAAPSVAPNPAERKAEPLPPLPSVNPAKPAAALPPLITPAVSVKPESTAPRNQAELAKKDLLQQLSEARAALKVGDLTRAKLLADRAATMKVALAPGDDSPAAIYLEIERLSKATATPVADQHVTVLQPPQPVQVVPPDGAQVKGKAVQLLAEGRRLQKAGKYIEARQRCLEAIAAGATFGADEDNPTQAVQQIATMAKQRMEALAAQATELANDGAGEALPRYQKADQMLQESRQLAQFFGFDTATVDLKIAWLHEVQGKATGVALAPTPPPAAPVVVETHPKLLQLPTAAVPTSPAAIQQTALVQPAPEPTQPPPPPLPVSPAVEVSPSVKSPASLQLAPQTPDLVKKGHELLERSRNELRAGALAQARKFAMEAMREEYGVLDEAAAVLRSIDTEAFNQKAREDQLTFDAAVAAHRRGQFDQASFLIGSIDPRNLDTARAERLREIIQTPGMMAMRQVGVAKADGPQGGNDPNRLPDSIPNDGTGRAHATDTPPSTPDKDILTSMAGMRNVLFQQQRAEGIKAMNDANDKFRTGDSEQALEVLKGYLAALETVKNLDANQLALLRKPVENRLRHFELMQTQDSFEKQDKAIAHRKTDEHVKALSAEEAKQKKIAELMKQCNALSKDGKLDEAYRLALVVQEMDPDNASVAALVTVADTTRHLKIAKDIKQERADFWLDAVNDADHTGPYASAKNPLIIDPEALARSKNRLSILQQIQHKSPAMVEMEHKLMAPASINVKDETLRQALDDVSKIYGLNLWIDEQNIINQGISLDRTVNLRLDGVMLKTGIELLLKGVNLSYVVRERHLEITTKEQAKGQLLRMTYPVTDLVVPVENSIGSAPGTPMLPSQNNPSGPPTISTGYGYVPTPVTGSYSPASLGTSVGTPTGGTQQPGNDGFMDNRVGPDGAFHPRQKPMYTREDALIKLITNTIEPNSWSDAGGAGTIDYFPMAGGLVINQSLDIQEQVADLLQALRRLQDQEVAIEVRLITVDEDYYERIGLDFSMDISTNARNNKFQPALLNGAFAPANQINSPVPTLNGLLAGITPAGTLTPDLSIPISPGSYGPATPPFGGYQGPGVGGLSLGLAFLSDIQVSMFLEAVAGDARSSISQSPRITMQNGQQAFLSVTDTLETLVTGVTLQQLQNGSFAVVPQIQAYPNQVQLQLSAVISADRRFVRLSPNLTLTNVAVGQPQQQQIPILLPIYPTLQPGEPGQAVVYTQFIQSAPRTSTIQIQTTVTVPDGGTVVMGGLKRMSEGRVEYGPPVLSKIPYINRLFRNVGYGRSGTSVLIMVTPRIIIQEEEEERATGFVQPSRVVP